MIHVEKIMFHAKDDFYDDISGKLDHVSNFNDKHEWRMNLEKIISTYVDLCIDVHSGCMRQKEHPCSCASYTNRTGHSYSHTNPHCTGYCYADSNLCTDAYAYAHTYTNRYGDTYTYTYGYTYADPHRTGYTYAYTDSYSC